MTKRLLHIVATPRGLASHTGRISGALLEELHAKHEDLEVQTLDLFSADLPAVAGVNIKTKYALMTGQPVDEAARGSWRSIERTIEEFLAADVYLLTVPMWNFGVPYALKYYIDAIVQPGYLFQYDERGAPQGLVHGKKLVCVTSRGADYSGPLASLDFLESYLRTIFGFVGHRRPDLLQRPADGRDPGAAADGVRVDDRRRACVGRAGPVGRRRPGRRTADPRRGEARDPRRLGSPRPLAGYGRAMDLFEMDETRTMTREEAAARLRALADSLAKHNSVEFARDGGRVTVSVPDEVRLKVEVELGAENEIEIELTW